MECSGFSECMCTAESFLQRPVFLLVSQIIVRSPSHVLTLHERQTWRETHFNDIYNHRDEGATILQNFVNRVPSGVASHSRKMDSSSTIILATAPTHSPSKDLPVSQHLHEVAGICNQFPPRPNTKNVCTSTPLPLPAFIFMVPPKKRGKSQFYFRSLTILHKTHELHR
jgi:hypothetical protein